MPNSREQEDGTIRIHGRVISGPVTGIVDSID